MERTALFIVLQIPFVDLRGLAKDAKGRADRPDWTADDPRQGFVRNFGRLSTRTAEAFGLVGERAYVEFDRALVFPELLHYRQEGWDHSVAMHLWFRRLYFDGDISGRFEIGLNSDQQDELPLKALNMGYDLSQVGRSISDIPVEVRSVDGSQTRSTLEGCGRSLGLAYLNATTTHAARNTYLATDLIDKDFAVGRPSLHIRVPDFPVLISKDRRDLVNTGHDRFFLTTVAKAPRRNSMSVQLSEQEAESPIERARRVLFSHLASVLFAHDFLTRTMDIKDIAQHRLTLKELAGRAIARFEKLKVTAPETDEDDAFTEALSVFAKANAGRIDQLIDKLEEVKDEAGAPSRLEKVFSLARGISEYISTTAIKAAVESAMKMK
jgi:hypothetical protein